MPAITRFCCRVSNSLTWRGSCAAICHRRLDAVDFQVWRAVGLVAEGEHADEVPALIQRGELPGQVLDVHAGAAVHVGGVLVGQDPDAHPDMIVRGSDTGRHRRV